MDIQLQEVGANICLNGTSKVNTHTDRHTDISTYRKHRPRGPMLWKYLKNIILFNSFENFRYNCLSEVFIPTNFRIQEGCHKPDTRRTQKLSNGRCQVGDGSGSVYIQIIRTSKSLCAITEAHDIVRNCWVLKNMSRMFISLTGNQIC